MHGCQDITGLVLAGGRGARMGGIDKGLVPYAGEPLALHVLRRLQAQTRSTAISANRHLARYSQWGVPVWPDAFNPPTAHGPQPLTQQLQHPHLQHPHTENSLIDPTDMAHQGPLAGIATGLSKCHTPWLLVVPCDAPLLPLDLGARLLAAALAHPAPLAVARAPSKGAKSSPGPRLRAQPVFCLVSIQLLDHLQQFMHQGGRAVFEWIDGQRVAWADFDEPHDDPLAFSNINTLADLQRHEAP